MIRLPDLAEMAGVVEVPPDKRGVEWSEIKQQARKVRVQNIVQ